MLSRVRRSLASPSMVVALIALVVALAGTSAAAAVTITGANIKNGSITGADIKNGALTSTQMAPDAITAANLKNGSVGAADLSSAAKASLKGEQGFRGEPGRDGAQAGAGPVGPTGPTGPTGPAGAAGSAKAYASVYVTGATCVLWRHSANATGCTRAAAGVLVLDLVRFTLAGTYPMCSVSDGATTTASTTLRWCGAAIDASPLDAVVVKHYVHASGTAPALTDPPSTNPVTVLVP